MDALERIKEQVENNPVVIYMKGTPDAPRCGFSHRASQALISTGLPFAYVNVLEDPEIRQGIKEYANWPTIPQLYIGGQFVGGSDIMMEMYESGELQQVINGKA